MRPVATAFLKTAALRSIQTFSLIPLSGCFFVSRRFLGLYLSCKNKKAPAKDGPFVATEIIIMMASFVQFRAVALIEVGPPVAPRPFYCARWLGLLVGRLPKPPLRNFWHGPAQTMPPLGM